MIRDEVKVAEGDLFTQLHLLRVVAELEGGAHLKHKFNLYMKGPYLVRQLFEELAPAIPSIYSH